MDWTLAEQNNIGFTESDQNKKQWLCECLFFGLLY